MSNLAEATHSPLIPQIILLLFGGGLAAWWLGTVQANWSRWVALGSLVIASILVLVELTLGTGVEVKNGTAGGASWLVWQAPWIPRFGIQLLLAADNLSLLLIILTLGLGLVALGTAWNEIEHKPGFFYFNLLWTLAGVVGIFTAFDLFLFFFFWEVMLIPMYLIIAVWGHENKTYAANKFFIFTQASGLLMLLAMVILVWLNFNNTGHLTFNYFELLGADLSQTTAYWLMVAFFIAFAVKLPSFPVHTWLPDAHTQAPTPGSVILAGILLKTGAYGLLRFVGPLFPEAAVEFTPVAMTLGVISILYGASLAFAQTDIKRLVAYSSISHMGFITLGVFAMNMQAYQGVILTMIAHGLSSAALFALAGGLQRRLHTRDINDMGGYWRVAPQMGATALFFALAALGLPGLANFIGEFLVLVGTFQNHPWFSALAALGMIAAPIYALWLMQKAFFGAQSSNAYKVQELQAIEKGYFAALVVFTLYLGFFPQATIDFSAQALAAIQSLSLQATSLVGVMP